MKKMNTIIQNFKNDYLNRWFAFEKQQTGFSKKKFKNLNLGNSLRNYAESKLQMWHLTRNLLFLVKKHCSKL